MVSLQVPNAAVAQLVRIYIDQGGKTLENSHMVAFDGAVYPYGWAGVTRESSVLFNL